jgi:hypothetical protein
MLALVFSSTQRCTLTAEASLVMLFNNSSDPDDVDGGGSAGSGAGVA